MYVIRAISVSLASAMLALGVLLPGCDDEPELAAAAAQNPAPSLRLVLTGHLEGSLEPCGCASAQAGGVDRRAWWLRLNKHRYDLKLEGGNLIKEDNPLERFKLMWIQNILGGLMEYEVFPLGPKDLSVGAEELEMFHDEAGDPFLVTDLRREAAGGARSAPYPTFKVLPAGRYKVCLLSLAGPEGKPGKTGYVILPPEEAVAAALAAAGKRGQDYDLALAFVNYGDAPVSRRLAKQLPGVDLLACFPSTNLEAMEKHEVFDRDPTKAGVARTQVLFPGWHGKSLLLWEGRPDGPRAWQTVQSKKETLHVPPGTAKGKRPPGSDPDVWSMLIESKRQIGEEGILEQMAGRHPTKNGARYVGDNACASCHRDASSAQKDSAHSDAWETLVAREKVDGWPVTRHPDCVSCHVVGFGERSGFVNAKKTPHLVDVGCEACHGAGSKHVDVWTPLTRRQGAGESVSEKDLAAAREKGKLGKVGARRCFDCHDFEQSPGFDFQERWEQIEHGLDK